jgi:hypothetical protein
MSQILYTPQEPKKAIYHPTKRGIYNLFRTGTNKVSAIQAKWKTVLSCLPELSLIYKGQTPATAL